MHTIFEKSRDLAVAYVANLRSFATSRYSEIIIQFYTLCIYFPNSPPRGSAFSDENNNFHSKLNKNFINHSSILSQNPSRRRDMYVNVDIQIN